MAVVLPDVVLDRVVGLVADALGRMETEHLPGPLRRVASFAPARRARSAAAQIAGVLAGDDRFRERVAVHVRTQLPHAFRALEGDRRADPGDPGDQVDPVDPVHPVHPLDPVDLAAVAYLVRPVGWEELVSSAAPTAPTAPAAPAGPTAPAAPAGPTRTVVPVVPGEEPVPPAPAQDPAARLKNRLDAAGQQLAEVRRRHRLQLDDLKAQNAELRRKLGEARARVRAAEGELVGAREEARESALVAAAAAGGRDAELRRLRSRLAEAERRLADVRAGDRTGRDAGTRRARLLLDTLLESAQGLRRELALPTLDVLPADTVAGASGAAGVVPDAGVRTSTGQGSLAASDPALLAELLALPRAHLVVDGYNVTKLAWPEVSLERQRDRLLAGLAPLAARSGAEVTVVFDAGAAGERPVVSRPRGVRVLFSAPGVIADDVIRELVAAEPRGRPLVVVSSDAEVVRDVVRDGARAVASQALVGLLARS